MFNPDLTAKLNNIIYLDNLQELYNGYIQSIESTLEIHAPKVNKITTKRRISPWLDHEAHQLKSKRRVAEKNGSETKLRQTKRKPTNH